MRRIAIARGEIAVEAAETWNKYVQLRESESKTDPLEVFSK